MRETHTKIWRTQIEPYRIMAGQLASTRNDGRNGAFIIGELRVICSDGMGWEHVSVSRPQQCPCWEEMCMIKNLFFDEEETVVQYHPRQSEYRNLHPYCLHLWKETGKEFPTPPAIMVA